MIFPKYNQCNQVNLVPVLNCLPEELAAPGTDPLGVLSAVATELARLQNPYHIQKESLLNKFIQSAITPEIQRKQENYILPAKYCLYLNIYDLLMKQGRYFNRDEKQSKEIDMGILECELRRMRNPGTFWGRAHDHVLLSYVDKKLTIPTGTLVFGIQPEIFKKPRDITVHHVYTGHYSWGIEHPRLGWKQRGEWRSAYFKDVFLEK